MMTINLAFTPDDWARVETDWNAWWEGELDRPLVTYEHEPKIGHPGHPEEFSHHFMMEKPVEDVIDFYTEILENTAFYWDTFPRWRPTFGIANAWFLGAQGQFFPESHSIAFEASYEGKLSDLHFEYDAENVYLKRALALKRSALQRWGNMVSVGAYDIFPCLDLLDVFRGTQKLSLDLYDQPDEVLRLIDEGFAANMQFYRDFVNVVTDVTRGYSCWAPLWSPTTHFMLSYDFTFMISPKMFERFVLPNVEAWSSFLDNAFFHMDGPGELGHLDMLLSVNKLKGIQWQPGVGQPTAENWSEILVRIREAGKLCHVYVPPGGALKIMREIGGKGFAFTILDYMSPADAEDFWRLCEAEF